MSEISRVESDPLSVEIGRLLGRREAFATVSGRSAAAEVEQLSRMRKEKGYRHLGLSWEEFCEQRLGASRRNIDRVLRLFDEFGPQYFHMAQIAHVTADEYRAIAPQVSDKGLSLNGEVIALLPENSERVSAAVAELVKREKPVKAPPELSAETVVKRCEAMTEALDQMPQLTQSAAMKLTLAILSLRRAAARKGAATL